MSYCRWSSDDFRSDVYAYASCGGGWRIHVAARKKKQPKDFPARPWIMDFDLSKVGQAEAYRSAEVFWQSAFDALTWEDLTSPSAGESFTENTLEDFRARMLALKAEGLRFPDEVLAQIDSEIAEDAARRKVGA